MKFNFLLVMLSIATTALCWGIYGPVLHWGQAAMNQGRLRPFICVGAAYFAIAIVVPLLLMFIGGWESEAKYGWTSSGIFWSLAGGAAGAIGALGIIMAFNFGGRPIYVMPLVFGCAPVVNTVWTMYWNRSWHEVSPFFAAGLILVAIGAATVLVFQPKATPHAPAKPAAKTASPTELLTPTPPTTPPTGRA